MWRGLFFLLVGCGRIGFETSAPGDCPPSYVASGTSCYRMSLAKIAWLSAEQACEADAGGAHLVVVDDEAERVLVFDMIPTNVDDVHMGASDRATEGTFRAVTGAIPFLPWDPGEPDGDQDCVKLTMGFYKDSDCDIVEEYICEYDGIPADPSAY